MLKIGELTRSEAMMGGELRAFHADDASAIDALHKSFVDHWAFEGDVGGSKIVAAMYASCGRWAKRRHSCAYMVLLAKFIQFLDLLSLFERLDRSRLA